ncbi:MAG: tRNA epoxyqueuosine(34) reductase QueG [Deltaproteobacteria bacterium]|nr:tRNA epoxyqueuosine(34) reductase QueG [Deltaproteobacteria bacterium]
MARALVDQLELAPPAPISWEELAAACEGLGVEVIGVAPLDPAGAAGDPAADWLAPHRARLAAWLAEGRHADMAWLEAQVDERLDPRRLLPGARSALTLWLGHRFPAPPRPAHPTGRVAAYAWGRDYHNILRRVTRQLSRWLAARAGAESHGSVDTSPVLERAFTERAAVGWIGKSTMLIHPRRGTYGSLAVLLTTAALPTAPAAHPPRCGTCEACWDVCPTGALGPEGLDARRCISYWTIERRGPIPREVRPLIGEWAFGCDLCQDVCPWNRRAPHEGEGARALWAPDPARAWPDLVAWLAMSDEALDALLLGSPLRRARPEGLKRNALVALANQRDARALPAARACLAHESPVVRGAAAWAVALLAEGAGEDERAASRAALLGAVAAARGAEAAARRAEEEEAREELSWALAALGAGRG